MVLSRSSALKAVKLNLPSVDRYQEPYDRPQKGTVLVEGVEPKYRAGLQDIPHRLAHLGKGSIHGSNTIREVKSPGEEAFYISAVLNS